MLFSFTLTFYCVDLYRTNFHTFLAKKMNLEMCVWAQNVKNSPSVEQIPTGLLVPIARGRMNELICSHCASLDILTHAALISYINGLLQVNDQLCEGPFARNMDSVKTSWESRCCCR